MSQAFASRYRIGLFLTVALCAGALAGCPASTEAPAKPQAAAPAVPTAIPPQIPSKATTPATVDKSPIQGQVDPKEPAQRRAFETGKP